MSLRRLGRSVPHVGEAGRAFQPDDPRVEGYPDLLAAGAGLLVEHTLWHRAVCRKAVPQWGRLQSVPDCEPLSPGSRL